jgi:hypothetical protein
MQVPPLLGPPEPEVRQCPSTASAGRKLMVDNLGGSYGFFVFGAIVFSFMRVHLFTTRTAFPTLRAALVKDRHLRRAQASYQLLLLCQLLHRALQNCVFVATRAERASSVAWNLTAH